MCVGRTPAEAFAVILEAVPAALGADVFYLELRGALNFERAIVGGQVAAPEVASRIGAVASNIARLPGAARLVAIPGIGELWGIAAGISVVGGEGRLFVGRGRSARRGDRDRSSFAPLAANLVGDSTPRDGARPRGGAPQRRVPRRARPARAQGTRSRRSSPPSAELLAKEGSFARERAIIERNTKHLARLVDDLLDISRVTRGNIELRHEPVLLAAAIERGVELASGAIGRQRHRVDVEPAGDITVTGDPVRLAQVFGNLVTNAAKFTPAGGRISIKVSVAGERIRIAVADDGRGIAADQLERIFEPFVQGDRKRDALSGGLGLGLAIVRCLVERHGGTITAASAGAGRGSTFTVELPKAETPARVVDAPARAEPPARGGLRVLVVDDNDDVATLLSEALELEGYTTAIAHDASGALEIGQSFDPHAAVLDVGLPGVDGYSLALEMRARYGRGIALIAATGYGLPRDRARSEAAGFTCHLVKPISIAELVRALDSQLGLRPASALLSSSPGP